MKKILQKMNYALLSVVLLLSLNYSAVAQEQQLLGWQFLTSGPGNTAATGNEATYNSTEHHAGVNGSVLSRASGLRKHALAAIFGGIPDLLIPDFETAETKSYYEFSFQPKAEYEMSLSQLNFKLRTSGAWSPSTATPLNFIWKYSIDGGANFSDIGVVTQFPAAVQDVRQPTLVLSDIPDLQGLQHTTTVIFRLYVWGFTNAAGSGTFGIGRSTVADPIALSLSGTPKYLGNITSEISEAYFTETKAIAKGETSNVIMDKLVSMIDNTPASESIHISIYMINQQSVMDALKAAEDRGVNLHLIVDMSRSDSQVTNATSLPWLQTNLPNSEIIVSVNDVSTNAINHHKFALFTKVQTADGVLQNVTFQTSHNFTNADARKIQDALVFNNADIYQAFLNNWELIKANASSGMKVNFVYNDTNVPAINAQLAFFPRITGGVHDGVDNILNSLNAITNVANAKVRIAMSDWDNSRQGIVDKLIALHNQGATIEVYAKDAAGTQTKVKLRQLQQLGATVRIFNLGEGSAAKFNIHAKMMLIEGTWQGQANAKVIITGSHNYTDGALKTNNEVLVTLLNSPLFAQYDAYFNELKLIEPVIKIVEFNLSSITGTGTTNSNVATFNSTVNPGGIINAFVSRGAGLKANTGLSEGFSSSHVYAYTATTQSTFTDAFSRDEYIQVQFQTKNSVKASLNKIEWILRKSSLTVPTHYRWYYSINSTNKDDFKEIGSDNQEFIHHQTAAVQQEINLSDIPELQEISGNTTVYLRLYIAGAINTSSSFGFRNLDGAPGFNLAGDVDRVLTDNLLGWDFSTSNNGSRAEGNEVFLASNITNSNLIPSKLKRGTGLNADDPAVILQRGFTAVSSDVTTSLEDAETNGNYFTFDVTPKANVSVSLSEVHINLRRSSAGGNMYLWKYKINDSEFVALGSETSFTSTNTNGVYQPVINLNNIAELQNVSADSIVFRLYVWGFNTANSGTFAVGRSADSYDLALEVKGTSSNNPLPVTLTKFEATKNSNSVKLSWQTASEQNNSHFDVLKSVDGKNWSLLTTIVGNGDSNNLTNYSAIDANPVSGVNYYQLKQVDLDGTVSLSKIESINYTIQSEESLAVNYSNNTLTLFINKNLAGQSEVSLFDLSGKQILNQNILLSSGSSSVALPAILKAGVYVVRIKGLNSLMTEKFTTN
jgi:phosphatidylserine/phosphatidylglycerophosphate/cardiolipin synthase-like enzyme